MKPYNTAATLGKPYETLIKPLFKTLQRLAAVAPCHGQTFVEVRQGEDASNFRRSLKGCLFGNPNGSPEVQDPLEGAPIHHLRFDKGFYRATILGLGFKVTGYFRGSLTFRGLQ